MFQLLCFPGTCFPNNVNMPSPVIIRKKNFAGNSAVGTSSQMQSRCWQLRRSRSSFGINPKDTGCFHSFIGQVENTCQFLSIQNPEVSKKRYISIDKINKKLLFETNTGS